MNRKELKDRTDSIVRMKKIDSNLSQIAFIRSEIESAVQSGKYQIIASSLEESTFKFLRSIGITVDVGYLGYLIRWD